MAVFVVGKKGKSALMNDLLAELAGKPESLAATIIGNCTTTIPIKFDPKDNRNTVLFGSTRNGMSFMLDALEGQYVTAGGAAAEQGQ